MANERQCIILNTLNNVTQFTIKVEHCAEHVNKTKSVHSYRISSVSYSYSTTVPTHLNRILQRRVLCSVNILEQFVHISVSLIRHMHG